MISPFARRLAVFVASVLVGCGSGEKNPSGGGGSTGGGTAGMGSGSSSSGGSGQGGAGGGSSSGGGGTMKPDPSGVFVAVGYGARRIRSLDDGKTWVDDVSAEMQGGDDDQLLRTVTFGKGTFVALGWRSETSADGKTWDDHGANIGQWLGGAVYANHQFVAVGGYGMRAISSDGVTWMNHSIDTVATHAADGIAFGAAMGGRFVVANDDGVRSSSSDGVTWTAGVGADGTKTTHLAFGNGLFLGVDATSVVTSPDGATWTSAATLLAPCDCLVFADGLFRIIADDHVFTSSDGASFVDTPVPGLRCGGLAYGHATYVLAAGTALRRSTDGTTWEMPFDAGGNSFQTVAFGPVLNP